MMELIALPDFHHTAMAALVGAVLLALAVWLAAKRRRKKRMRIHSLSDLYEASKALYPYRDDQHVASLLHSIEEYKYRPDASMPPRSLIKAIEEVLDRKRKIDFGQCGVCRKAIQSRKRQGREK